jgi:hypothetical protein
MLIVTIYSQNLIGSILEPIHQLIRILTARKQLTKGYTIPNLSQLFNFYTTSPSFKYFNLEDNDNTVPLGVHVDIISPGSKVITLLSL